MAEDRARGLIARLDALNEFERTPSSADKLQDGRHWVLQGVLPS
jgi:hypothetical protein